MDIEEKCIAKTREYELRLTREDLESYIKLFERFEPPFTGISITRESFLELSIKQILLLPVGFILIMILVLLTPIAYVDHIVRAKKRKENLNKKIKTFQNKPLEVVSPTEKTIDALWRANYPTSKELKGFNSLDLLYEWVDILYGEGTSNKLKLRRRGSEIVQSQVEANAAYYEEENAPHFFFKQPAKILAEQLSQELPFYAGVEKFSVFKTADGFGDPQAT